MRIFRNLFVALGVVVLLAGGLSACGSDDDQSIRPSAYGPTISGHASCAYVVSPQECATSGVPQAYWYQMPSTQPVGYSDTSSDLLSQMFLWHMIYQSSWYSQPGYYNTYVPASYRTTYVTQYVTPFNRSYGSRLTSYNSRAKFVDSAGKPVPPNKVTTTRINTPPRTTSNSGGNRTNGCNYLHATFPEKGSPGGGSGGSRGGSTGGGSTTGGKTNPGGNRGQGGKTTGC